MLLLLRPLLFSLSELGSGDLKQGETNKKSSTITKQNDAMMIKPVGQFQFFCEESCIKSNERRSSSMEVFHNKLILTAALSAALVGCGGGSSSPTGKPPIS